MAQGIVKSFGEYTHRQAVKQESLSTEQDKPAETKPAEQPKPATQPTVNRRSTDGQSQGNNEERTPILYYAVQICASRTPLEPSDPRLKGLEYDTIQVGEWIKYYTAADPDKKKVSSSQQQLKPRFPDCWIIKFEK